MNYIVIFVNLFTATTIILCCCALINNCCPRDVFQLIYWTIYLIRVRMQSMGNLDSKYIGGKREIVNFKHKSITDLFRGNYQYRICIEMQPQKRTLIAVKPDDEKDTKNYFVYLPHLIFIIRFRKIFVDNSQQYSFEGMEVKTSPDQIKNITDYVYNFFTGTHLTDSGFCLGPIQRYYSSQEELVNTTISIFFLTAFSDKVGIWIKPLDEDEDEDYCIYNFNEWGSASKKFDALPIKWYNMGSKSRLYDVLTKRY